MFERFYLILEKFIRNDPKHLNGSVHRGRPEGKQGAKTELLLPG